MEESFLVSCQRFSSLGEHLQARHGNTYEIKLHVDGAAGNHARGGGGVGGTGGERGGQLNFEMTFNSSSQWRNGEILMVAPVTQLNKCEVWISECDSTF